MKIAIFDDTPAAFYPASLTRSVGDIRCGALKLRQRLQALLDAEDDSVVIDSMLMFVYQDRHPDWEINHLSGDTLLVNSRLYPDPKVIDIIRKVSMDSCLVNQDGEVIAFRTAWADEDIDYTDVHIKAEGLKQHKTEAKLLHSMADVIAANGELIRFDYEHFFHDNESNMETEPGVTVLNPYQVWIGEGVVLKPGVVVDASDGPVIIDEGAVVMANSVIMGPAYIGKQTKVKIGAKIYENTSIGPVCKIGGEVEGSIIQAYSNKQHDGFLGHAWLGEWVNLGADTNNSDLKNNYKQVSFYHYPTKGKMDSGSQFLGCIIGDHSKTGINCSINTGTVMGVGCNVWGRALINGFIPSFSWGEADDIKPYIIESFLQTAAVVKQRRKLDITENEKILMQDIRQIEQNNGSNT